MCVLVMGCVCEEEDNFGEWVLFTMWVWRIKLRLSGLAFFTHGVVLPTPTLTILFAFLIENE